MIPAFQLCLAHNPEEGKWGDCLRACMASLFEKPVEEVPHFTEDADSELTTARIREWLKPHGLVPMFLTIPVEEYEESCAELQETGIDAFHLLAGAGPGGVRHIVVARWGRCVHDPSPENMPGRGALLPDPRNNSYDFVFFVRSFA